MKASIPSEITPAINRAINFSKTIKRRLGSERATLDSLRNLLDDSESLSVITEEMSQLEYVVKQSTAWIEKAQHALTEHVALRDVVALVQEGKGLPVALEELPYLQKRAKAAQEWLDSAQLVIRNPRTRGVQSAERTTFADIEALLNRGVELKLDMIEVELLREQLGWCIEWRQRVGMLFEDPRSRENSHILETVKVEGQSLPAVMPELDRLQDQIDLLDWAERVDKALAKRTKLKALQNLLEEALNRGFKMHLLDKLQSVVSSAEQWSNHASELAADWATLEQLEETRVRGESIQVELKELGLLENRLQQGKNWLEEAAEAIRQSPEGDGKVEGTYSVVMSLHDRALDLRIKCESFDQLNQIVEVTQAWVDRVRKVVPRRTSSRKAASADKATIDELEELLQESSQLPLETDEVKQLRDLIVEARAWLEEAQEYLNAEDPDPDELKRFLAQAESIPVAMPEVNRLEEILQLQSWAWKTRHVLSTKSRYRLSVELLRESKHLPEDRYVEERQKLQQQVASASAWLEKYRSCDKEEATPAELTNLLEEGLALSVDLEETRSLESSIKKSQGWAEKARTALSSRVRIDSLASLLSESKHVQLSVAELELVQALYDVGQAWRKVAKKVLFCRKMPPLAFEKNPIQKPIQFQGKKTGSRRNGIEDGAEEEQEEEQQPVEASTDSIAVEPAAEEEDKKMSRRRTVRQRTKKERDEEKGDQPSVQGPNQEVTESGNIESAVEPPAKRSKRSQNAAKSKAVDTNSGENEMAVDSSSASHDPNIEPTAAVAADVEMTESSQPEPTAGSASAPALPNVKSEAMDVEPNATGATVSNGEMKEEEVQPSHGVSTGQPNNDHVGASEQEQMEQQDQEEEDIDEGDEQRANRKPVPPLRPHSNRKKRPVTFSPTGEDPAKPSAKKAKRSSSTGKTKRRSVGGPDALADDLSVVPAVEDSAVPLGGVGLSEEGLNGMVPVADLDGSMVLGPMDPTKLYCICRRPDDGVALMIQCDQCDEWFHGDCVNVSKAQANKFKDYQCQVCCKRRGVPYLYSASEIEPPRAAWDRLQLLLSEAEKIPLVMPETQELTRIKEQCQHWLDQARSMLTRPDAPEAEILTLLHESESFVVELREADQLLMVLQQRDWLQEAKESVQVKPNLRQVTKLVKQASTLRFPQQNAASELLKDLELRAKRGNLWTQKANELINRKGRIDEFVTLIRDAEKLPVHIDKVDSLRKQIEEVQNWADRARDLLDVNAELERMQHWLNQASSFQIAVREYSELKLAVDKAVDWTMRAHKALAEPNISVEKMKSLAAEAKTIPAHLPLLPMVEGRCKIYCLCQEADEGRTLMICCDKCDEWFHIDCVNVTKAQAKKINTFVCPTCAEKTGLKYMYPLPDGGRFVDKRELNRQREAMEADHRRREKEIREKDLQHRERNNHEDLHGLSASTAQEIRNKTISHAMASLNSFGQPTSFFSNNPHLGTTSTMPMSSSNLQAGGGSMLVPQSFSYPFTYPYPLFLHSVGSMAQQANLSQVQSQLHQSAQQLVSGNAAQAENFLRMQQQQFGLVNPQSLFSQAILSPGSQQPLITAPLGSMLNQVPGLNSPVASSALSFGSNLVSQLSQLQSPGPTLAPIQTPIHLLSVEPSNAAIETADEPAMQPAPAESSFEQPATEQPAPVETEPVQVTTESVQQTVEPSTVMTVASEAQWEPAPSIQHEPAFAPSAMDVDTTDILDMIELSHAPSQPLDPPQ
eukprot:GILK01009596.1.p1 GENE.GILK01009596.1~~GILK01009596.1.p1  ORF type:complete len:1734 (+),score=481.87 GILK01009596.1:978-6179(+)